MVEYEAGKFIWGRFLGTGQVWVRIFKAGGELLSTVANHGKIQTILLNPQQVAGRFEKIDDDVRKETH